MSIASSQATFIAISVSAKSATFFLDFDTRILSFLEFFKVDFSLLVFELFEESNLSKFCFVIHDSNKQNSKIRVFIIF
ncbi:hypothetical protein [Borreliella afzelii]|uniref:Uncharacterized protein n=1 Tax=Borreliella afzelii TaxID=29518 RepID=A0A1L4DGG0_BORAF|nr:hypothetical protein BLA32_05340 [Borreliella afzelii]